MPTHHETRVLPYSAHQMFDLVADVRSYPQFLPWTAATRISSENTTDDHTVMLADLVVSFKVFRETFASKVTMWPTKHQIDTSYIEGPFKHMESRWVFRDIDGGVEVVFDVDFEFKNRLLQSAAGMFFNQAMQTIVRAFETRAQELYG